VDPDSLLGLLSDRQSVVGFKIAKASTTKHKQAVIRRRDMLFDKDEDEKNEQPSKRERLNVKEHVVTLSFSDNYYESSPGQNLKVKLGEIFGQFIIHEKQSNVGVFNVFKQDYNKSRGRDSAVTAELVVLDIEDTIIPNKNIKRGISQYELNKILHELRGFSYIICSTYNDRSVDDTRRVRLIIPLNRAVTTDEYETIVIRLIDIFGSDKVDIASSRPSQLYHLPASSKVRLNKMEVVFHDGFAMNVDQLLDDAIKFRKLQKTFVGTVTGPRHRELASRSDINAVCNLCPAYDDLWKKFQIHERPSYDEKLRIAQLCLALGFSNEKILSVFSKNSDFDQRLCLKHLEGLRRKFKNPGCSSLSVLTNKCDGNCLLKIKARTQSPVGLIDWNINDQILKGDLNV
jgi:hypothetical protein